MEVLDILYDLENIQHNWYSCEVSVIIEHKPLVAIFKKDSSSVLHRLQRIILHIHFYKMGILYKQGPQLFIADCLSRQNHEVGKHEEIPEIDISINMIETCMNIPECMTAEEIWLEIIDDEHIGMS